MSTIDLAAHAPGEDSGYDSEEFTVGQAAHGYSVSVVTASGAQPAQDPGISASFLTRVDPHSFYCVRESDE
ncbi:hypothetical protein [Streptomyces sp. NPDC093093]|uniref:hypothetical protein n=1 Tax=Streptomyces sp. NPDC093093 TaxID=3366025 RepID=UPI00382D1547